MKFFYLLTFCKLCSLLNYVMYLMRTLPLIMFCTVKLWGAWYMRACSLFLSLYCMLTKFCFTCKHRYSILHKEGRNIPPYRKKYTIMHWICKHIYPNFYCVLSFEMLLKIRIIENMFEFFNIFATLILVLSIFVEFLFF